MLHRRVIDSDIAPPRKSEAKKKYEQAIQAAPLCSQRNSQGALTRAPLLLLLHHAALLRTTYLPANQVRFSPAHTCARDLLPLQPLERSALPPLNSSLDLLREVHPSACSALHLFLAGKKGTLLSFLVPPHFRLCYSANFIKKLKHFGVFSRVA